MQAVLEPLARAVLRAREHEVVGEISAPALRDFVAGLGFDPFTRDAAARAGFDPRGPLLVARGEAGGAAVAAVGDRAKVEQWLQQTLGARAADLGGEAGWRWPEGVGLIAEGALFAAADGAALTRLRARRPSDESAPDPVAACPRARGEADLYVWSRAADTTTCFTVRVDPGRVRLDARLRAEGMTPTDWLAAEGDLPALRADPAMALGVHPGPALSALLGGRLDPARRPAIGPLALTLGPGALDVLFAMQPADAALLNRFVEAARGREDVTLDPPDRGLRRIAVKAVEGQPAPPVSQLWFGTAHGRTWIGTDRGPIDAGPGKRPTTGLSSDLFAGAGLTLYLRPGGLPHDGGPWADAVAPRLTALGLDIRGLQDFAGAFAWLWAHLGEIGLAVRPEARTWRIALEAVTL